MVKNLHANAGDTGDMGSIPGSGRSPGGGQDHPLQYSCMLVLLFSLLILHLTALSGYVCMRGGRLKKEVIVSKHRGIQIF